MNLILPMTALYNGRTLWGYVKARVEDEQVLWVEIMFNPEGNPTAPGRHWAPFCAMQIIDVPPEIPVPEGESRENRIVFTMFKENMPNARPTSKSFVVETPEGSRFTLGHPRTPETPEDGGAGG